MDEDNGIVAENPNAAAEEGGTAGAKKRRKLPAGVIVLIVIGGTLALLVAGMFIFVNCTLDRYIDQIDYTYDPYDPFDTAEIPIDSLPPGYFDDETPTPEVTVVPVTRDPADTSTPDGSATPEPTPTAVPTPTATPEPPPTSDAEPAPLLMSDKVYNILLIGTDTRDLDSFRGNSDVILLVSFNSATHKIWLTSFHRDSYVHIPGVGYRKINSAYAYAGAKLLQKTLQEDFLVVAPNYVIVNFESFVKVVDAIGGVEITLTAEEANGRTVAGITQPGTYTLNGKQALGYARERHLANDDWGRTQRHRNVVSAIIKKMKTLSVSELLSTMDVILPLLTTNIPKAELKSRIAKAPEYSTYSVSELSIPVKGTWHNSYLQRYAQVIMIDSMWTNIVKIRDNVYRDALD